MKLLYCLLVVALVTICEAQRRIRPPRNTRIPWRYVTANSVIVLWRGNARCATYNAELLDGYSTTVLQTSTGISILNKTFTGLEPQKVYGARVQCVASNGDTSVYGRPGRSKTIGRSTTVAPTTYTGAPPVDSCGNGAFTCGDGSCIDAGDWCNQMKDCEDGSDERDCPGYCDEITEFHPHGNFSCSLFNSPQSACFFDCDEDFLREGPWYTVCVNRVWTRVTPICRLAAPRLILEPVSRTVIKVLFTALDGATDYRVISFRRGNREIPPVILDYEEQSGIVEAEISGLDRGQRYTISIAGVDTTGTQGATSRPTSVRTNN